MPDDPYAEFGGGTTAAADPYAEFAGKPAPAPPPSKGFLGQAVDAVKTWAGDLGGDALPLLRDLSGIFSYNPESFERAQNAATGTMAGIQSLPGRTYGELVDAQNALLFGKAPLSQRVAEAEQHVTRAVPGMGPPLAEVPGEIEQGEYGKVTGHVGAAVTMGALPEIIKKAKDIPVFPSVMRAANPKVQAALDYLESKGVPIPAAARTSTPAWKHVQKIVDVSPIGAFIADTAGEEARTGLQAEAQSLINRATPQVPADTLYSQFRNAEADPQNIQRVQVGTKQQPMPGWQGMPGAPTQTVPVYENIGLPVKVADLKPSIRPIYNEMGYLPTLTRESSAAYSTMEKILNGPDYVSASEAEQALSGLKSIAREGSGRQAGIAKFLIPQLQGMIDDAADQAATGSVKQSLQQGRIAAARQMGANWLKEKLMEKSGAEAEGEMGRSAGIWRDWQNLDAKDKLTLFRDPRLVDDIGKFMLGWKRMAENPNPSGSGVLVAVGQSGLAIIHPVSGVPMIIGQGALSKMMHTRAGVQALMNGVRVSLDANAPAAMKAAVAGQILRQVGDDAYPLIDQSKSSSSGDASGLGTSAGRFRLVGPL